MSVTLDPSVHRRPAAGSGPPPHVRDHLPPRRRQDDAHGEAPALRRRHRPGRLGHARRKAQRADDLRLDGAGARARHLDHLDGAAVRATTAAASTCSTRRATRTSPRTPTASLTAVDSGGHGDRRGQGHRAADAQALRGLPPTRHADLHVREQAATGRRRDPLELLDELEARARHRARAPVNWPIGDGDRTSRASTTCARNAGACSSSARCTAPAAPPVDGVTSIDDPALSELIGDDAYSAAPSTSSTCSTAPATRSIARPFLRGRADAGVLRQRASTTSASSCSSTASSTRARAAAARDAPSGGIVEPADDRLHRLRLQDPGEHGPAAPRPHRVRARVLRAASKRHDGHPRQRPTRRSRLSSPTSSSAASARPWTRRTPATWSAW